MTDVQQKLGDPSKGDAASSIRSKTASSPQTDAENDSGVDESTQRGEAPTLNGIRSSPSKRTSSKSREADKGSMASSPVKSPSKSAKSLPRTPDTASLTNIQDKKIPMNKVQVGAAPSPNLKTVKSKIGSLGNTSYKPGGGKIKIENRKLDFSKAQPKIAAKNDKYAPSGGDKKIQQVKLQWNAKSKVGSLENATHKPGGGDKKIETVKLDFKDKAKPKVGSKDNAKHVPGGGTIKSLETPPNTPPQDTPSEDIETQKIDIKAESKIGSLNNVKHKPGGGDKKIFNDKDYLRQTGSNAESLNGSGSQISQLKMQEWENGIEKSEPNPPPSTPTRVRVPSSSVVTPRAIRTSFAKSSDIATPRGMSETSPRKSLRSPNSARPPSSLNFKTYDNSSIETRKASPAGLRLSKSFRSPLSSPQSESPTQSRVRFSKY